MKVAHLDSGREWRGGQRQLLLLMRGLRERGVANVLLAPDGPLSRTARSEGFDAERWESRGDLDVAALLQGRSLLRGIGPDVVHCHAGRAHALGVPAARMAGAPRVVVSRRVDFHVRRNPFSAIKYGWGVDVFICISRGVYDIMRADGVPAERLRIVYSGVPMEPQHSERDLRAELGLPAGAKLIGTVAAFAAHKNHPHLMRAAAEVVRQHPRAHFVWLGDGSHRASLERLRGELGLEGHVHMPGHVENAIALLDQFDLFVMPSRTEGLGTSLLDAQVAGVPIIATRTGGIPDVVTDGVTGRLVGVDDVQGLAVAIREALAHPEKARRWAAAARESVRRFSADRMAADTLEVYRELAAAGAGDAPRPTRVAE